MRLIFDIGYNVGAFTKVCFDKHPGVIIVAVEANPSLCNVQDSRVHMWNRVASDKDDVYVDFYIEPRQSGISTASVNFMKNSRFRLGSKNLKKGSGKWKRPIKIGSITIDTLIDIYGVPDLIKIDVEGYERNVLMGLTKPAKDICFEWHEEGYEEVVEIVSHLRSLGYSRFGVIGWFDEGDVFEKATFSSKGDPHLIYPDRFYSWEDLDMDALTQKDRRVNYGMFFAKT